MRTHPQMFSTMGWVFINDLEHFRCRTRESAAVGAWSCGRGEGSQQAASRQLTSSLSTSQQLAHSCWHAPAPPVNHTQQGAHVWVGCVLIHGGRGGDGGRKKEEKK